MFTYVFKLYQGISYRKKYVIGIENMFMYLIVNFMRLKTCTYKF